MSLYEKALGKAGGINAKDYLSSIAFFMAALQVESGKTGAAIQSLKEVRIGANKIEDKELKADSDGLLQGLQHG